MARHNCIIIDELFERIEDRKELKDHIKIFTKAVHEAHCKQSARVVGVNKYSPIGFIKARLREQEMPLVDYNPVIRVVKIIEE